MSCRVEDGASTRPVRVAVINPGMGNLRSVVKAWEHAGATTDLVERPDQIGNAQALVFPGQGAMVDCMENLKATGFDAFIKQWIEADKPFFGICLGLQALFEYSEEGQVPGLGIFPGRVERFRLDSSYKIPHMGWNTAVFEGKPDGLLEGIGTAAQFYFVHSYHVVTDNRELIWCKTDYGYPFVSGIRRGNCFATQFHPEKSQAKGLQIYHNFLKCIFNYD